MSGDYVLTRRVVKAHNTERDAWVVVNDNVYDVTLFLRHHPGGAEVLRAHLGEDVTALMAGAEGAERHSHSKNAYKILRAYLVGRLADAGASAAEAVAVDGTLDEDGKPLVDFHKPLLHQVGMLGDKYERWVHSFPTGDHQVHLFAHPTLESLTKCPWYVPLLVWPPVMAVGFVYAFGVRGCDFWGTFLPCAVAGYVFWMLFEYALHRYAFHAETRTYWGNIVHFLIHGHHHLAPQDYARLVFPPVPAALVSLPVWAGALRLLGSVGGLCFMFGFGVGYLSYDMTHFLIHYTVPQFGFLRAQKRRHMRHHFRTPNANFGISNHALDILFGTLDHEYA
ncbi:hypothetical protein CDCA_CDCA08G2563 [Cyanidium caldarium]|uniref:Fatty acid 2-hydroxylase n=1 Tax=Cyanidium caldarium TaxID=2771 RepID=A0AAV9IXL3_CYACA|nr:hypothetical protein CDCA_CDCA08G2563 [Cyanidium caldarium]